MIAFKVMLSTPGLIEYRDAKFHYKSSHRTAKYFHTWNSYKSSDNFPYLNQFPMYFWWSLIENTELGIRLLYFIIFVLIGTIIFLTVFSWLKERYENKIFCYIASIVALFVYMVNPWVTFHITHPQYLWSYAFTPLTFYFTHKAVNQMSIKGWLKYSLLLSLVLFLTTTSYVGIAINIILFAFTLIFEYIFKIKEGLKNFFLFTIRGTVLFVFVLILTFLLFAYYFLPYTVHYGSLLSTEAVMSYKTYIMTIENIIKKWTKSGNILKAITGVIICRKFLYVTNDVLNFLRSGLTVILPVLAYSALIFKPKNKTVLCFSVLALLLVFLAKVSNEPFGGIYVWLHLSLEKWLAGLSPIKFIQNGMPLLYLSYAWLCGIAIIEILNKMGHCRFLKSVDEHKKVESFFKCLDKKRIVGVLAIASFFCSIFLINFPFFSGDFCGTFIPIIPPSEYYEMNRFLESQEGEFRVYWLPPSRDVIWNPSRDSVDPWLRRGIKDLPLWISSRPTTPGASILQLGKEPEWKMFEYYIYEMLNLNKSQYAGKLLSAEGVKYVIYHNDIFDYEKYHGILQILQKQRDLNLEFKNNYLYVFANRHYSSYVYSSNKALLIIGGLDILSVLCDLDIYDPNNYPLIFMEQYPLTKTDLETYLKFADTIIFYGEKDLNDLFLSTIGREFLYSPADFRPAFSPWKVDFFFSSKWIKRSFLQAEGLKYDFDLNMKIIFSNSNNQTLNLPIKASSEGTYEIWARVLQTPKSGNITFTIDNSWRSEISAKSYKRIKGFKWIKVLETFLEEGEHTLTITNNFGINAINIIAVVPKSELEQHKNDVLSLIKNASSRILYLKDLRIMDRWPASGACISKVSNFYVPKKQNYIIAIQTYVTEIPNSVKITIDDISYSLRLTEGENFNYIGPISLEKGNHKIIIQSKKASVKFGMILVYSTSREDGKPETINDIFRGESANCIINYEKVNPALVKVSVNATKPFILSFAESLDPLWIAYADDGTNFPKVTINSVLNGFLVGKIGTYTIMIEFVPEKYLEMGRTISLITFLAICCGLFYLTKIDQEKLNLFRIFKRK